MKTSLSILVLLVIFAVVFFTSAFSQQQIQNNVVSGNWGFNGGYYNNLDAQYTKFFRDADGGAEFWMSGGTVSFSPTTMGTDMWFLGTFSSPWLLGDSLSLEVQLQWKAGDIKRVSVHIGLTDTSIGSYYPGEYKIITLDSSRQRLSWDMSEIKKAGWRSISQMDLAFKANTVDSCNVVLRMRGMNMVSTDSLSRKTDIAFNLISTGVKEVSAQTPKGFALEQNYPNPFNPSTTIRFSVPQTEQVSLKVYNSLGQEVQTLVNEVKGKGNYEATFNASNLPSGTYFYRLQAGVNVETKKMMLVK